MSSGQSSPAVQGLGMQPRSQWPHQRQSLAEIPSQRQLLMQSQNAKRLSLPAFAASQEVRTAPISQGAEDAKTQAKAKEGAWANEMLGMPLPANETEKEMVKEGDGAKKAWSERSEATVQEREHENHGQEKGETEGEEKNKMKEEEKEQEAQKKEEEKEKEERNQKKTEEKAKEAELEKNEEASTFRGCKAPFDQLVADMADETLGCNKHNLPLIPAEDLPMFKNLVTGIGTSFSTQQISEIARAVVSRISARAVANCTKFDPKDLSEVENPSASRACRASLDVAGGDVALTAAARNEPLGRVHRNPLDDLASTMAHEVVSHKEPGVRARVELEDSVPSRVCRAPMDDIAADMARSVAGLHNVQNHLPINGHPLENRAANREIAQAVCKKIYSDVFSNYWKSSPQNAGKVLVADTLDIDDAQLRTARANREFARAVCNKIYSAVAGKYWKSSPQNAGKVVGEMALRLEVATLYDVQNHLSTRVDNLSPNADSSFEAIYSSTSNIAADARPSDSSPLKDCRHPLENRAANTEIARAVCKKIYSDVAGNYWKSSPQNAGNVLVADTLDSDDAQLRTSRARVDGIVGEMALRLEVATSTVNNLNTPRSPSCSLPPQDTPALLPPFPHHVNDGPSSETTCSPGHSFGSSASTQFSPRPLAYVLTPGRSPRPPSDQLSFWSQCRSPYSMVLKESPRPHSEQLSSWSHISRSPCSIILKEGASPASPFTPSVSSQIVSSPFSAKIQTLKQATPLGSVPCQPQESVGLWSLQDRIRGPQQNVEASNTTGRFDKWDISGFSEDIMLPTQVQEAKGQRPGGSTIQDNPFAKATDVDNLRRGHVDLFAMEESERNAQREQEIARISEKIEKLGHQVAETNKLLKRQCMARKAAGQAGLLSLSRVRSQENY